MSTIQNLSKCKIIGIQVPSRQKIMIFDIVLTYIHYLVVVLLITDTFFHLLLSPCLNDDAMQGRNWGGELGHAPLLYFTLWLRPALLTEAQNILHLD